MKKYLSIALALLLVAMSTFAVAAAPEDLEKSGEALLELETGELKLIYTRTGAFVNIAGDSVNFGQRTIGGQESITAETNLGVVVQDARGLGSASKWQVSLQLGNFYLLDEANQRTVKSLLGSKLTLDPNGAVVPGSENNLPIATDISLTPDDDAQGVPLFSNNLNGSAGTWGANWKPTLDVPTSAEKGTHQATLTWTLAAVA